VYHTTAPVPETKIALHNLLQTHERKEEELKTMEATSSEQAQYIPESPRQSVNGATNLERLLVSPLVGQLSLEFSLS
jgi:hypothetical protein